MEKRVVKAAQAFSLFFVVSIPLSFVGSKHRSVITDNSFFEAVNYIFVAGFGVLWFSVAFWGYTIGEWVLAGSIKVRQFFNSLTKFLIYIVSGVFFNAWFFGPSLVERLNTATGGHCADGTVSAKTMAQCRADPSLQWVDGFDLSGHYYFLVTSSLLLIDAISQERSLAGFDMPTSIRKHPAFFTNIAAFTRWISFALIAVWVAEFCVTSIFFHTVWEKASGLLGIPIALGTCAIASKSFRIERSVNSDAVV